MISLHSIPPVTKNLLILNIVVFVIQQAVPGFNDEFVLYHYSAPQFEPYQILSHMFMHASIGHLFSNMFALYMFGSSVEQRLGDKKYLIFYLLTGFGAVILHAISIQIQFSDYFEAADSYFANNQISFRKYQEFYQNINSRGASGAVFGLLAAFALLFPNQRIMLLIPPIPLKAKYFVLIYAGIELVTGLQNNPNDNVAHFAHLGGALFGFIIIREWRRKRLI